jgi:hypothetical protein
MPGQPGVDRHAALGDDAARAWYVAYLVHESLVVRVVGDLRESAPLAPNAPAPTVDDVEIAIERRAPEDAREACRRRIAEAEKKLSRLDEDTDEKPPPPFDVVLDWSDHIRNAFAAPMRGEVGAPRPAPITRAHAFAGNPGDRGDLQAHRAHRVHSHHPRGARRRPLA